MTLPAIFWKCRCRWVVCVWNDFSFHGSLYIPGLPCGYRFEAHIRQSRHRAVSCGAFSFFVSISRFHFLKYSYGGGSWVRLWYWMSEVFSRRVSSSSHLILIRFIFHPCIYVAAGEKQSLAMDNCRCGMPFKDLFYPMAPFFNSKFVWGFEGLLSKQSFFKTTVMLKPSWKNWPLPGTDHHWSRVYLWLMSGDHIRKRRHREVNCVNFSLSSLFS